MASFDWNNFTVEPFDQEDTSNVAVAPPPTIEPIAPRAYAAAPSAPPEEPKPSAPPEEQKPSEAPSPPPTPAAPTPSSEGIVAVDPRVYPFGSILRDEKSGQLFLASDKATQKSGETRQFSVVGKVAPDYMPKTPEQVRALLDTVALSQGKQAQPSPHDIAYSGDLYPKIAKDREPLVAQVDKNPELKKFLAAAMSQEAGDDVAYLGAVESLFNRTQMQSGDIYKQLTNGFYGPINRGEVGRIYREGVPPWMMQKLDRALDAVRNGSDLIEGRTDQGMRNEIVGPKAKFGSEYFGYMGGDPSWSIRHQREKGEPGRKGLRTASGPTEPTGPIPTESTGPIGHDTAPDGTRPMGEGRYIWPGEKNPAQPAGEGKYIWPGAQRASPEEIENARYGPFRNPLADTAPPPSEVQIAEASGFPWPKAEPPEVRWAEPVHGYTPAPTPMSVYGYNPSPAAPQQQPDAFQLQRLPGSPSWEPIPGGAGTQGEAARRAEAGRQAYPELTPSVAAPAVTPAPPLAVGPTREAAAQLAAPPAGPQLEPRELAKSRNPGEQLTSYLNMINRGMTSEGILSMIEGLDALALSQLPDWKVLDWLRDNLKSEQKQTAFLRNKLRQDVFPVDRATTESKVGQVLQVLGQAVPTAGLGAAGGGARLSSAIITGLQAAGQLFDEARQDALAHNATPEQANRTALQYLAGAGVFEYLSDRFLIGRFFHGAGKLTLGQISKEFAKGGALEGVTEPTQQLILNSLAKGNYDPDRPLGQDVLDSAIVGVFGGGIGAAGAHVAGHLAGKATQRAQQGELQQAAEQLKGVKAEDLGTELTAEEQEAFKKAGVIPETKPPPEEPPSGRAPGTAEPVKPTKEVAQRPGHRVTTPEGKRGEIVSEEGDKLTVEWNDGTTSTVNAADVKRSTTTTITRKNTLSISPFAGGLAVGFHDAEGNFQSLGTITRRESDAQTLAEATALAEKFAKENNLAGYYDHEGNFVEVTSAAPAAPTAPTAKPPTTEGGIKPSLAMAEPAAPETVKIQAFDPKAREFVETEMKPTKELHEQLKREENSYQALIKCLEL